MTQPSQIFRGSVPVFEREARDKFSSYLSVDSSIDVYKIFL